MERATFKERFHELRGEKTQEKFAKFLGMSRPTVGFYENGDRIPDLKVIINICEKCGVTADWLLGISDIKSADPDKQTACEYTGLSEKTVDMIKDTETIFESDPDYYEYTQGFDLPLAKIFNVLYENGFMIELGKAFGCFLYHLIISNNQWFEHRHSHKIEQEERIMIPAMWNLNKQIENLIEKIIEPLISELSDYYMGNVDL